MKRMLIAFDQNKVFKLENIVSSIPPYFEFIGANEIEIEIEYDVNLDPKDVDGDSSEIIYKVFLNFQSQIQIQLTEDVCPFHNWMEHLAEIRNGILNPH